MICYSRLPLIIDTPKFQLEVSRITQEWLPHFNTLNYDGKWTALALRSPGGQADIVPDLIEKQEYADTIIMADCEAISAFISSLSCPVLSVRLLNLHAGAYIKPHCDHELAFEKGEARLHFPIFTNPQVEFFLEEDRITMLEGECWYINASLTHHVANHGSTDRIHLVVDCLVNDWLENIFSHSEKFCKTDYNLEEQIAIINELRQQNTEAANNLAESLEHSVWLIS
ncbi:MAG: aspartyl/asparaginyl beta-hydroxylase domain-containing protein [Sphingobacteriaceae bacterium]|nr:aspartyl/asparaginyl beta-hydroxylase domain-containing protein [Sphingobacteriaceae bacterium]